MEGDGSRRFVGRALIVESAQVFDTHHIALLVAAGASAVVPYLAEQFAESLEAGGTERMRAAINAGLLKVLARMGVSTLASYRNSHLFEIVGLSEEVCAEFFEDAADFPDRRAWTICLAIICACTARRFRVLPSNWRTRGCIASERARSCTLIRRKLCGACMRTCARRMLGNFPLSRNWRRARARCFCATCWRRAGAPGCVGGS